MPTDLILVNADIRTLDPLQPRARALAVAGGPVIALGDDAAIRLLANASSKVIDAGGRLVLPGFQDTHIHLQDSGTAQSTSADLEAARDLIMLDRDIFSVDPYEIADTQVLLTLLGGREVHRLAGQ